MVRWCLLVSMVFLTLAAAVVHGIEPIADPIGWSTLAYPESGPCMQWRAEYLAKRATQQQLFVDLLVSDGRIVTLTADVESSQAIFDACKADWQAVFADPTATKAEKNLAQSLMNSAANVCFWITLDCPLHGVRSSHDQ